jgi:hypothetical protein
MNEAGKIEKRKKKEGFKETRGKMGNGSLFSGIDVSQLSEHQTRR